MQISVNGEAKQVKAGTTVSQLVAEMGLGDKRVAVEVNEMIVPRSEHPVREVQAGDRVEIVTAIGGG